MQTFNVLQAHIKIIVNNIESAYRDDIFCYYLHIPSEYNNLVSDIPSRKKESYKLIQVCKKFDLVTMSRDLKNKIYDERTKKFKTKK